jgi:1-acyl-sn-glycerol-3-phosphate acyltransferase
MYAPDLAWAVGRPTLGGLMRLLSHYRVYGKDRMPSHGGVVLAINHFSWIDTAAFGNTSSRTIWYMAKAEAIQAPVLGLILRAFGSFAVRRGESDREAIRYAREIVASGRVLGLFVEGTRQRSGTLGKVQPGAAMIAMQENAPIVCGAVHGSLHWKPGNMAPVSVALSEPFRLDGLPKNARGYREGSEEIGRELRRQWEFLDDLDRLGRPKVAVPPARP